MLSQAELQTDGSRLVTIFGLPPTPQYCQVRSLSSITEITEYRYFSPRKPIRELKYKSE